MEFIISGLIENLLLNTSVKKCPTHDKNTSSRSHVSTALSPKSLSFFDFPVPCRTSPLYIAQTFAMCGMHALHRGRPVAISELVSSPDSIFCIWVGRESGASSQHFCPGSGMQAQVLVCKFASVRR